MNAPIRPIQILLASLLAASSLHAATITWNAPQTITGDSDVSTAGTLIVAHNLGTFGNTSATVNGVEFTPFVTSSTINTVGNVTLAAATNIFGDNFNFGEILPPFSDLSVGYQTLLQSASYTTGASPATITLTVSGLTVGAEYQFQWWANQSNPQSFDPQGAPPLIPTTTATAGNSVTLDRAGLAPGSVGEYAIGTFTATAPSQAISFDGTGSKSLINGFQLRQLGTPAIPEPGAILFGMATAGFMLSSVSRRRQKR